MRKLLYVRDEDAQQTGEGGRVRAGRRLSQLVSVFKIFEVRISMMCLCFRRYFIFNVLKKNFFAALLRKII